VGRYTKHLNIIDDSFDISKVYTNRYVPETPFSDVKPIACCIED
jgi:hypothetical protein